MDTNQIQLNRSGRGPRDDIPLSLHRESVCLILLANQCVIICQAWKYTWTPMCGVPMAVPLLRHNWFNHWPWSWTQSQLLLSLWRSVWCQESQSTNSPITQLGFFCFVFCFLSFVFGMPDLILSHLLSTNSLQTHLESSYWNDLSGLTINSKDTLIDSENLKDLEGISQEMGIKATPFLYSKVFEIISQYPGTKSSQNLYYTTHLFLLLDCKLFDRQMRFLLLWIPHNLWPAPSWGNIA